jgi:hypothetical protein
MEVGRYMDKEDCREVLCSDASSLAERLDAWIRWCSLHKLELAESSSSSNEYTL